MPYLIDGHNLIAEMPGMRLGADEDEAQLLRLLRGYCERSRVRATVYFDQGRRGGPLRAGPRLTARFVVAPGNADQAIIRHLARLGREAQNWTVVSSDREIRQAAARAGARQLTSREFARLVTQALNRSEPEKPESAVSKEDVAYWERRFRQRRPPSGRRSS